MNGDINQTTAWAVSIAGNTTVELLYRLFTDDEARQLKKFSEQLKRDGRKEVFNEIWLYDQSLGGLGAFAMPSDPTVNPFNTWGQDRNLFRSIQYAKASIVHNPTYPRGYIVDVGRSLEITSKYILDRYSIISRLQNKEMLGKSLLRLHNKKIIGDELYENCRLMANLYNLAKHGMREDSPHSFSLLDGLVAFFSMRKIHNQLMVIIDHRSMHQAYAPWADKT